MAAPAKRRKLSKSVFWDLFSPERVLGNTGASPIWSHGIEDIGPTRPRTKAFVQTPQLDVKRNAAPIVPPTPPRNPNGRLLRRQDGTGASSPTPSQSPESNPSATTTTNAASTDSSAAGDTSSPPAPAISGLTASVDSTASPTDSLSAVTTNGSISSAATSTPSDVPVSAATGVSTDSAAAAITALTASGAISSGFTSAAVTNATLTSSPTITDTLSTPTATGAAVFAATLPNGDVVLLTRESSSYPTTLPGGFETTISPYQVYTAHVVASESVRPDGSTVTTLVTHSQSGGDGGAAATIYQTSVEPAASPASTATSTVNPSLSGNGSGGNASAPPASAVAGGVVGGVAGLAVIVLLTMLMIRYYRRQQVARQRALAGGSMEQVTNPNDAGDPAPGRGPGMAERAGLLPAMAAAVPSMFKHLDRSTAESSTSPTERGFSRISGRKLPSAFSEGMVSPPPNIALTEYERNAGLRSPAPIPWPDYDREYGAHSADPFMDQPYSPDPNLGFGAAGFGHHEAAPERMTVSPGPARRPHVQSGPGIISPSTSSMASPSFPIPPGQFNFFPHGRSSPSYEGARLPDRSGTPVSQDGSRGSRFTEVV